MNRAIVGAVLLAAAVSADAAVVVLDSMTPVADGMRYEYRFTLGPDEGLRAGDSVVVFDFAGYVDGSIFGPEFTDTSVEFTSLPFVTPGETDDPSIVNLVWTYNGPDFQTTGGPYAPITQTGFGAVSIFDGTMLDAFTSETTKNNPPDAAETPLVQGGFTRVPSMGVIPEPASWALMIAGFGLVGASIRSRRQRSVVVAA